MEYIVKNLINLTILSLFILLASCASPPTADPSKVEAGCAQKCSAHLAECSSGFKFFPVVAQQQCNDTYDVCIKGCPARDQSNAKKDNSPRTAAQRLENLAGLFKSGQITKEEYDAKRKEILDSL